MEKKFLSRNGVKCIECIYFKYYQAKGIKSFDESLGMCLSEPWDGAKTQWPYHVHPCKNFSPKKKSNPRQG